MSNTVKKPGFIWGVASSAAQTEGATIEDGKGHSIWDVFSKYNGRVARGHSPNPGTDFYNRYPVDLDIIRVLGIPNFRFSISWSRLSPGGGGQINKAGLDFYDRLVDSCLLRGIEPWITLYHWDLPHALELRGGWLNRDIVDWYLEYAQHVLKRLSDRVSRWMVLNEPLTFTGAGYFLGIHAPGKRGLNNFLAATHHACLVQAEGIRQIKSINKNNMAGTTFSCTSVSSRSESEKELRSKVIADAILNRLFIEPLCGFGYPLDSVPALSRIEKHVRQHDMDRLKSEPDFIGIQYYTRLKVAHAWHVPYLQTKILKESDPHHDSTANGWAIHPEGLHEMIEQFSSYPGIREIYITENGAAFHDRLNNGHVHDDARTAYLKAHIEQVLKAKARGLPVMGYFVWSLTDNFEWAEGYNHRFGLVYVDYVTQRRFIKQSAFWYSKFISDYGLRELNPL